MVSRIHRAIDWPQSHRLIPSHFPPIDLFDDIADPEDWELLAHAESRTNPRIYEDIGNLALVPVEKRVNSSWAMAPFVHISRDRPSRFSDGSFGIYYCAKSIETALRETIYHRERFMRATSEPAGQSIVMRELIAKIEGCFVDICDGNYTDYLRPDDYKMSQSFGAQCREDGENGIVYPSIRHKGGECLAVFWPNLVGQVKQGAHWQYHWDGEQVDYIRKISGDGDEPEIYRL